MKFLLNLDTFVISDTHFGHQSVLEKEPLRNELAKKNGFKKFDVYSIKLWNSQIKKDDFVLHLGDLYFKDGWKYLKKLQGTKRLIVGNNDLKKYQLLKDFDDWSVCKKIKLKITDKKKILHKIKAKYTKEVLKDKLLNAIIMDLAGERIMFSHFPVMDRKRNDRYEDTREILDNIYKITECSLNIHGHTHSRNTKNSFCLNMSGENIGFVPLRIRDVLSMRH